VFVLSHMNSRRGDHQNFGDMIFYGFACRYTADFFLESAVDDGTHVCSYLLATDMDMEPVPGYKFASWEAGYGDIHLAPDMKTLRIASW
jgi:hypothetical protein